MTTQKYLTFDQYNGSLGGLQAYPAGPYDTSSPGGMSSIDHHWTHGLYGKPERTYDVYAGTGDRYVAAEYGNLYRPNSHADVYSYYGGPDTVRTDYKNMAGQPYFWEEKKSSIEGYEHVNMGHMGQFGGDNNVVDGSFELISPIKSTKNPSSQPTMKTSSPQKVTILPPAAHNTDYYPSASSGSSGPNGKTIIIFVLLIIMFITFEFWWEGARKFLYTNVYKDGNISAGKLVLYASIITVFLFSIMYVSGISFQNLREDMI